MTPLRPQSQDVHSGDPGMAPVNFTDVLAATQKTPAASTDALATSQQTVAAPSPQVLMPDAQTCSPDNFLAQALIYKFNEIVEPVPFRLSG